MLIENAEQLQAWHDEARAFADGRGVGTTLFQDRFNFPVLPDLIRFLMTSFPRKPFWKAVPVSSADLPLPIYKETIRSKQRRWTILLWGQRSFVYPLFRGNDFL
ncbi:hypothetical protein D5R40_30405 [Okeania hirsuta]|uniref:Uncharacterized protein n=1 Tax=Okeania hirsuta TaxID=1458930 RepID=A0A3N6NVU5_9CYAN|nr:hypothetical protein D5R40_30405 [Okeania hirsuta]